MIIPSLIINILGVYTVGLAIYIFFTCSKFTVKKLVISVGLVLAYVYFESLPIISLKTSVSIGACITLIYFLTVYIILHNKYYKLTTYKDNPSGLIMFGKKYAIMRFQSEFVASCIKVKDIATRSSVKKDIDSLYNTIKREMSESNIDKSIAEYSEERIKRNKDVVSPEKAAGSFNKGVVTLNGGISLPICEFSGGVPVVYIRGLDNHITRTLEFARKSKVGTDIKGQNYIYPITPYLNKYEIELFTDADNITITFKEYKLKALNKETILKSLSILDKVIDCYSDFYQKIKDTLDDIATERLETEIEMQLKNEIEQLSSILSIYKVEVRQRESDGTEVFGKRDSHHTEPKTNKTNTEKRSSEQKKEVGSIENIVSLVKSRQEVFAEGMNELESLIGLNSIKNEIKQLVDKHKLDKYASKMGLPPAKITSNFVFIGSPGVGKTTVARILAKLLYGLEIIGSYEICEVSRADMVGKFIGETEEKTKKILSEVIQKGCLLLIEEFHQLYDAKNDKDYGKEAIKVLMPALENYKDKFSCVVTGYGDMISSAIKNADPGLESRFSTYLYFENFKAEELVKIIDLGFCGQRYNLDNDSRQALRRGITHLIDAYTDFSNARDARKIFEKAIKKQTKRLSDKNEPLSKDKLMLINKEDIDSAIQEFSDEKNKMEKQDDLTLQN